MKLLKAGLRKEVTYKVSRSSGKGGQNVNKVSSKVELLFDIQKSALFSTVEKIQLQTKLHNKLSRAGYVQIVCEEERSQLLNKERALHKLHALLLHALEQPKVRKPASVSKAASARRIEQKRIQSVKKQLRRNDLV